MVHPWPLKTSEFITVSFRDLRNVPAFLCSLPHFLYFFSSCLLIFQLFPSILASANSILDFLHHFLFSLSLFVFFCLWELNTKYQYHHAKFQLSSAWRIISPAQLRSERASSAAQQCRALPCSAVLCGFVPRCAVLRAARAVLYLPFRTCQVSFEVSYIEKIKLHSSCEIEHFVETHLCKLCVILRSRVLLGVSSLRI